MKRCFFLAAALLVLPVTAYAGEPNTGTPLPLGEPNKPLSYKIIPLSEVRVISLAEMQRTGGLLIPKSQKQKKKKKKQIPLPALNEAAILVGMGATYEVPRTWGDAPSTSIPGDRAPAPVHSTVTRATSVAAPEPGSAALALLLLPAALGYFRVRSKNA